MGGLHDPGRNADRCTVAPLPYDYTNDNLLCRFNVATIAMKPECVNIVDTYQ
jgi:hypothetical protein